MRDFAWTNGRRRSALAAMAVVVTVAFTLLSTNSLVQAQTTEELERYGQRYIEAKKQYDKAIAESRYRDAVKSGREMVDLIPRLLPDRQDLIGTQHHWLAIACSLAGLYDEADTNYSRAIELREAAHGPDHLLVAETLYNATSLYRKQARYADAEAAGKRSLAIREKQLGPDHVLVGDSSNNLAAIYFDLGGLAEAEALLSRALAIHEKKRGPSHVKVALQLANLASIYRTVGQFELATEYDQRALAIRTAQLGRKHADTAFSINNLGLSYATVGRFNEAVQLYEEALAIRTELLGADHPDTLVTLNNLAVAYGLQRRFTDALALHRRVYESKKKLLGDKHPSISVALANMATLLAELQDYEGALQARQEALAIVAESFGKEHPSYAFGLMNRGQQYQLMGRHDEASSELQQAVAIFEKAYGRDHPDVASALGYLAEVHIAGGRLDEAAPLLDRVIAIRDLTGVSPGLRSTSYYWRSQLAWKQGDLDAAEKDLLHALELAEQQRSHISGGAEARAEAFAQYRRAYEQMVALQVAKGDVAAAFRAAERGRARSLIDQMAAAHVDLLAGLPAEEVRRLNERERRAELQVAELERALQPLNAPHQLSDAERKQRDELAKKLGDARQEVISAYAAIRNASPGYRQIVGKDNQLATIEEIQQSLVGDRGILFEYALGATECFVIVVPGPNQPPTVHRLAANSEQAERLGIEPGPLTSQRLNQILIDADGKGVVQLLGQPASALQASQKLAALWEVLVPTELRPALAGQSLDRLLIVPDGMLNLLPFEALVVEASEDPLYLLDVGPPITYGPTASLMENLNQERPLVPSERKPVLTVGDPAYAANASPPMGAPESAARYGLAGGSLAPLPFSGREAQWVSEVFQKQGIAAGLLNGAKATEGQVRFNVAGRRVVHLACHGLADEKWGNLFGALALAPGDASQPSPADDGFLTLAEIYELDMQGCQLAILSACNTNYGPELLGEGVWALSRGFLVAGARRVVASNWLVDDEAAASLISVFCGSIAKEEAAGKPPQYAAALHAAKHWTRRQEKWRSPYYWATFVELGAN